MNEKKKAEIKKRILSNPNMIWMIKQYLKRGQLLNLKNLGFSSEEVEAL